MSIIIVAAIVFVWWFIVKWRRISRRLERDLPGLMDNSYKAPDCEIYGHIGPPQYYANYRIWLCCGTREDHWDGMS